MVAAVARPPIFAEKTVALSSSTSIACRTSSQREGKGFTLVEVLVALCVSAILMALLARTLHQTMLNSEILAGARHNSEWAITLRRILHRDIQGMGASSSLRLDSNSFSFITSNTFLMPVPFPIVVTWSFKDKRLVRIETRKEIAYEKSDTLVSSLEKVDISFYQVKSKEWIPLNVAALNSEDEDVTPGKYSAVRIVLFSNGDNAEKLIERFPNVSLKK